MAQVLSMGIRSTKYCVARMQSDHAQYLKKVGPTYAWHHDIREAVQFNSEEQAEQMASRIAGGAVVAEMVEA